jgi:molecular chaperone GrpE
MSEPTRQDQTPTEHATEVTGEATSQPTNEGGEATLECDLKKLQEDRDALFERLARVSADFKNAQKRLQQEKEQAIEYANAQLIKALLPIIDNFERALGSDPAKSDAAAILKGMRIVYDQWFAALAHQHVTEISPKSGDVFDPTHHQALMQQDDPKFADSAAPVVVLLLQKGYMLRDRVLRPAQVAVNKIEG